MRIFDERQVNSQCFFFSFFSRTVKYLHLQWNLLITLSLKWLYKRTPVRDSIHCNYLSMRVSVVLGPSWTNFTEKTAKLWWIYETEVDYFFSPASYLNFPFHFHFVTRLCSSAASLVSITLRRTWTLNASRFFWNKISSFPIKTSLFPALQG